LTERLFDALAPQVRDLLAENGITEPTPPQTQAWPLIARGEDVLIIAPTGSGKTEAALLPLLGRLVTDGHREGISLLYITPMRALNRDMLKRLQVWCGRLGLTVDVRHGDTPQPQRSWQSAHPPDVLVTTPETLQAILPGRRMRENLSHLKAVVVDELHNLVESKRGVQLCVGLQRLRKVAPGCQLVALSATVGTPDVAARFLFGEGKRAIVKVETPKEFTYEIEYPAPDASNQSAARETYSAPDLAARLTRISDLIERHTSTLIFVNSRTVAEMLGEKLARLREDVGVHHGSLPKEERERVEQAFKAGQLKALVCIPEAELIVTSRGVKQAKNVKDGDEILSYDIQAMKTAFKPVVRKYERVADGFLQIKHELGTLRITPNHPVLCLGPAGLEWKPAGKIQAGDAMVTVAKIQGKDVPTHQLLDYPNLFVRNSAIRTLGYEAPGRARSKVSRFNSLKPIMTENDLAKLTEFNTTQARYHLPAWVDARLGYLLGFLKSDGDRHMRFFNSDPCKLARVEALLSEIYNGTPYRGPNSDSGFPSSRPRLVLQAQSKPLASLFANMWNMLPLPDNVVAAILAAYLDGDGCIVVRDGSRLEQIQFTTFNPVNREYLLYSLLALGFKPKLWKTNGVSGLGYSISVVYNDEKSRFLALVKDYSFKAAGLRVRNLGNKPTTYYGLGSYIRERRKRFGMSSYRLWKEIGYSTKYENQKRGITKQLLARLNEYLHSPLIDGLILGKFGIAQVRAVSSVKAETNVVNFEVEGTQNYAVTGVVTHNCTSTMELGIDIGSVDLVVQYMSPRQVTSLVQRVGRSGHNLGRISKGILVTVSADDILESSASILSAGRGRIEPTRPYVNSLDVLAHQVAGYLMDFETMESGAMLEEVRKAAPFSDLQEETFNRTVGYLAELRKLRFDGKTLSRTRLTREYYYENLSMIPDETRYLVVDVSTNMTVGILGEEFVLLKAKVGVHFICKGKVWQVEQVADDRKIYVTPVEDPLAAVATWDGEMLPIPFELALETGRLRRSISEAIDRGEQAVEEALKEIPGSAAARALVFDEIAEHKKMGAAVPSDKLVLFEGFGKYLVVHLCFGESVNRTFAYVFEELLSRRGLVRMWWLDGYRILMELTADTEELDLKVISRELIGLSPEELEKTYAVAARRNFPFPARVKHVAERFGALERGKLIAYPNLCSLPTRFEKTPIFEEALQESGRDLIDMERSKKVLALVAGGEIAVETFQAGDRPTPIAYGLLYRYLEVPEVIAPDSLGKSSYQRMKASIFGTDVSLVCMKCGTDQGVTTVGDLQEEPKCASCGSGLLAPCYWGTAKIMNLLEKKSAKAQLNEEERAELSKARRRADLVLSYGKRAVVAQTVYGIGPQTASRILAQMHDDEETFYNGLLEAKIRFVTTRQFWGN